MSVNQPIDNEEAFIARYLAPLASGCLGTFGLEDDAAVLSLSPGEELVITTDAVAAGVHFFADDAPEDIAWKALAVNVSDLAAKGATPLVYQMALSFPDIPDHQWMKLFTSGLAGAQKAFEIRLSGGDTDRRPGPLSITITAMGTVPMGKMIRRGGAAPDDVLFVTGTLGDGALGLLVRAAEPRAKAWGLDTAGLDFLRQRYLRPAPRMGLRAVMLDHVSAAMDISDGLAKDLGRLCKASGVAAEVRTDRLPLSDAAQCALTADPGVLKSVVSGGDDYELLLTVPRALCADFETGARAAGVRVTPIGRIARGSGVLLVDAAGAELVLDRTGWDHMTEKP